RRPKERREGVPADSVPVSLHQLLQALPVLGINRRLAALDGFERKSELLGRVGHVRILARQEMRETFGDVFHADRAWEERELLMQVAAEADRLEVRLLHIYGIVEVRRDGQNVVVECEPLGHRGL